MHPTGEGDVRLTSKGQVTIPQALREELGMRPGDEVAFERDGDALRLTRAPGDDRGARVVARLRGSGAGDMTTDEIMALMRGED